MENKSNENENEKEIENKVHHLQSWQVGDYISW